MKWIDITAQSVHKGLIKVATGLYNLISGSFGDSCEWFSGSFPFKTESAHSSDDNRHIINKSQLFLAFAILQIRIDSHNTEGVFALVQNIDDLLSVDVLFAGLELGFY